MMEVWQWISKLLSEQGWIGQIFFIVLITMVLGFTSKKMFRRLQNRFQAEKRSWVLCFVQALRKPFILLIWILGIGYALDILQEFNKDLALLKHLLELRTFAVVVLVAWFLIRFVQKAEDNYILIKKHTEEVVDETMVRAIGQVLRASALVTSGLVALPIFGINITGVVAFGGIGALTIGLAAKDLLGNFFGGMMIYFDRPFSVGEWVRSPDRGIEGTVEHIGWRLTRIRTFDKRPLFVPNGVFSNIVVENPSRMFNRRIRTTFGVRYDDASKIPLITKDVEAMLYEHSDLDSTCTTMVHLVSFGPSSLDILIYAFTKTTNWKAYLAIQQDVFLKIIEIIDGHGAECAFPTTTVHMPEGLNLTTAPDFDPGMLSPK